MDENRQRWGRHVFAQLAAASSSVFACPVHCRGARALADPTLPVRRYRGAPSSARRGWALRRTLGGKHSAQRRRREGV